MESLRSRTATSNVWSPSFQLQWHGHPNFIAYAIQIWCEKCQRNVWEERPPCRVFVAAGENGIYSKLWAAAPEAVGCAASHLSNSSGVSTTSMPAAITECALPHN